MAERVITVKLNVDASGAEQGLQQIDNELLTINEQLVGVEDNLRNLTKEIAKGEAAKQFESLNKIVEKNVLSIQDLGVAADNYKNIALAAGVTTPIGQEALKKAAQMETEMDKLNQSVAHLAEGGRGLNAAMQIGTGVVAGYTAFQGVTALLGEDNEKLQETFVKLQAAQSVLMGVKELSVALDRKGLIVTTAQAAATNLMTAAQAAYATVVGTSTGALKLFRIALISTGIGALIVGLGLLIANFDKVSAFVKRVINEFGNLHDVLLLLLGPIGWAILAYEKLFKTIDDSEKESEERRKALEKSETKRHEERLKQIDKEKEAKIAAADETIKALELEKDTLEAEGKSSDAVTIKILEGELAKVTAVLDANKQKIQSTIDYYRNIAALRGQDEEEFKASMKAQNIDLDDALVRANKILEENGKVVQFAENKITKFKREQGEKRAVDAENIRNDILTAQVAANDAYLALELELTNLLLQNMEEGAEKELAILMDKQGRERDALIEQHGENAELLAQLDIKQEGELEALQEKFRKERLAKEEQYIDELIDLRLSNMSEGKDKELELLRLKHDQELEEIRLKYGEQTELEKELLLQQKSELKAVEDEFDEQARQEKIDKANETLETIQGYLDQAEAINELLNEIGDRKKDRIKTEGDEQLSAIEKQKKAELSREGITANQKLAIEQKFALQEFQIKKKAAEATDKINKKAFQREKAFKIASIAMDTASAIVKALASSPPPLNFINAGIVGSVGIAQGVVVASQKFEGSAGNIQPPSFAAPSVGGGGGGEGSTTGEGGSAQTDVTTETAGLVGGGIVLSMVEVNQMQSEMQQIDEVSTL